MIEVATQLGFSFVPGVKDTRDGIVERHGYLCKRGARKYARRIEDRADFEQIAAIGLIKAVDRYRPELKTPFEAYAWMMIQGELSHYVRDCERLVRPPRRMRELDRQWNDARRALLERDCLEPSEREIGTYLGWDEAMRRELHEYRMRETTASLDAISPQSAVGGWYTIDAHDDRMMLERALALLAPLERSILQASVQHGWSIGDIAARLGYSPRHVARLRRAAIAKLTASDVLTAV